jgi:hypothetical protein
MSLIYGIKIVLRIIHNNYAKVALDQIEYTLVAWPQTIAHELLEIAR